MTGDGSHRAVPCIGPQDTRHGEELVKNKQMEALIKKAAERATSDKRRRPRFVDPTLQATKRPDQEEDADRQQLFKDMKRREF